LSRGISARGALFLDGSLNFFGEPAVVLGELCEQLPFLRERGKVADNLALCGLRAQLFEMELHIPHDVFLFSEPYVMGGTHAMPTVPSG
jgi:hypothetical protein